MHSKPVYMCLLLFYPRCWLVVQKRRLCVDFALMHMKISPSHNQFGRANLKRCKVYQPYIRMKQLIVFAPANKILFPQR